MQIIHHIDDFLLELFPKYKRSNNNLAVLKEEVANYYSYGIFKPRVSIEGEWIKIDIDSNAIISQEADYNKVVSLAEQGKYTEAKRILRTLIQKNPTQSEYHRILGQILSEEGQQEESINSLIDALKWNPKNGFALVMMGNIFSKYKNDIDTALKYYDQAVKLNEDDYIALNNIGANLLNAGRTQEGINYLEKAYKINSKYPNTLYALSIGYNSLDYPLVAFDYAIKALKAVSSMRDPLFNAAYSLANNIAEELSKANKGRNVFDEFRTSLEKKTGKQIRVEADPSISTAAKIEYAENHNRDYHIIKYKPNYHAVEHLMMHELVHLEFATEARQEHCNMLFLTGYEKQARFVRDHEKDIQRLRREGLKDDVITNFLNFLYEGINAQLFNAPVDLFIEDYLFEEYPELHPYQFLSLQQLVNEGMNAVTNKQAEKLSPRNIFSTSKILNLLNAFQLKDLYGIDLIDQFNALPSEKQTAERFWSEFSEYRKDRKAGEEYELIQHWGEDLKMENYFDLVDEEDFRSRPKTVEAVLNAMEDDPFGLDVDKNFKEKQTQQFHESAKAMGTNPAVVMFMVDALQFFKGMPKDKIRNIAFEIAMIGTQGIDPASDKPYRVGLIPNKEFSGFQLLAYYYVSWKLSVPEMLKRLGLPYEKEYTVAESLSKSTQ
jgi:tetratricopeptide (TPR) repeat protein